MEAIAPAVRAYAEGEPIEFRFDQPAFSVALPEEPDLQSFRAEVNLHDGFFTERRFDPAMATAAIDHEVEHLREWLTVVRAPGGARAWQAHARALKADGRLHALDNMVDDVRMNRTVVERSPSLRDAMGRLYSQYAFPSADLRTLPSGERNPAHLQFAQSLLRDAMLPTDPAVTDPAVRAQQQRVLDEVNRDRTERGLRPHATFDDVIKQIGDPSAAPASRLALTRRYLEPAYQALYEKDAEEETQRRSGKQAGDGQQGEQSPDASAGDGAASQGEGKLSDAPAPSGSPGQPGKDGDPSSGERAAPGASKSEGSHGESKQSQGAGAMQSGSEQANGATSGDAAAKKARSILDRVRDALKGTHGDEGVPKKDEKTPAGDAAASPPPASVSAPEPEAGPVDLSKLKPDELFPEAYREHARRRPMPMDHTDWQKVADELAKKVAANMKPLDLSDPKVQEKRQFFAEHAEEHPTEQDWKNFQAWHALRQAAYQVRDAEGRSVIDELRAIFANILSHRKRKKPAPKAPQEEGDALSPEHLVDAWMALRHRDETAEVWQVERTKERPAERVGQFDLTLVGDLSESMLHGGKDTAQRQAMVLLLAALEEFRKELAYSEGDLRDDLAVRTEAWAFGNAAHLLKPLTDRLEPLHCARVVGGLTPSSDYGTHEYTVLAKIREAIDADPRYREKLLPRGGRTAPEVHRVVLVLTDGDSGNLARCQQEIAALRQRGVKVAAIGITAVGAAVVTTYAPDGRVSEDARDLARTAGLLLRDILKDPDLGYTE